MPFPVEIVPTDMVEVDTFLIDTLQFTLRITLTESLNYITQTFEYKVINVCAKETMSATMTEFLFLAQKNKLNSLGQPYLMLNNTEVPKMFLSPVNITCEINSWYISLPSETTPINLTDDIAIRMMQVERTEKIDAITVDTTQELLDHQM